MAALTGRIDDLEASVAQLRRREQQLMMEMKKRGALARQLCSSKDEEIRQLREKLDYDQTNHSSTSPSSKPSGKSLLPASNATSDVKTTATFPPQNDSERRDTGRASEPPMARDGTSVDCDLTPNGDGEGLGDMRAHRDTIVDRSYVGSDVKAIVALERDDDADEEVRVCAVTVIRHMTCLQ